MRLTLLALLFIAANVHSVEIPPSILAKQHVLDAKRADCEKAAQAVVAAMVAWAKAQPDASVVTAGPDPRASEIALAEAGKLWNRQRLAFCEDAMFRCAMPDWTPTQWERERGFSVVSVAGIAATQFTQLLTARNVAIKAGLLPSAQVASELEPDQKVKPKGKITAKLADGTVVEQ